MFVFNHVKSMVRIWKLGGNILKNKKKKKLITNYSKNFDFILFDEFMLTITKIEIEYKLNVLVLYI